jgi:T-cell receptor beta chain V region
MHLGLLCCVALYFWGAGKSLFSASWTPVLELFLVFARKGPFWAFSPAYVSSSTVSTDTEVTQSPRHVVKQKAKIDCIPVKGHSYVYWYRKKLEEELKFLLYFQNEDIMEKTEFINERVSAQCPANSSCSVEIQSTELADSGLYFCASSQYTVMNAGFQQNSNSSWTPLRK